MAPTTAKRDEVLELLRGPAMEVTIVSGSGAKATWSVPKALLSHHSGYFQRVTRPGSFLESNDNKVTLEDFEPNIFKLFIEFIYYGRYSYRDDLTDGLKVRDSAEAWVLGDYLDAVEFKNFAIRNLYNIYFPDNGGTPRCAVGPKAIEHCCSKTITGSNLYALYQSVLIVYWHDVDRVLYSADLKEEWEEIWDLHSAFRNDILYYTNQERISRQGAKKDLEDYLEKLSISDEPGASWKSV